MKMSPTGVFVIFLGLIVGLMIWVVGYNVLPNTVTHRDLSKNNKIATSVSNATSNTATGSGSSQTSSSSNSSSSGQSSATSGSLPTVKKIPASQIHFTDTSMPGYKIFENTCANCHGSKGEGAFGPAIYAIGKYWNAQQLTSFVENPSGQMPKNGTLSSTAQVKDVVDWLVKQKASGGN